MTHCDTLQEEGASQFPSKNHEAEGITEQRGCQVQGIPTMGEEQSQSSMELTSRVGREGQRIRLYETASYCGAEYKGKVTDSLSSWTRCQTLFQTQYMLLKAAFLLQCSYFTDVKLGLREGEGSGKGHTVAELRYILSSSPHSYDE